MGGPRVSSGNDSKQDYRTPHELIAAIERLVSVEVAFDLAAHRGNARHERYFAPDHFIEKYDPDKPFDADEMIASLTARGGDAIEAEVLVHAAVSRKTKCEIVVSNGDSACSGHDALQQDWAHCADGLLWLNPEFSDIGPWARKCAEEAALGAEIALLVPASVGALWFRAYIARRANVYLLADRVCFDGKNAFPKDCLIAHYSPIVARTGTMSIWSWKTGREIEKWR